MSRGSYPDHDPIAYWEVRCSHADKKHPNNGRRHHDGNKEDSSGQDGQGGTRGGGGDDECSKNRRSDDSSGYRAVKQCRSTGRKGDDDRPWCSNRANHEHAAPKVRRRYIGLPRLSRYVSDWLHHQWQLVRSVPQ